MKKMLKLLSLCMAFCYMLSVSVVAMNSNFSIGEGERKQVGVMIETVEEKLFLECYRSGASLRRGNVDLSQGNSNFSIGVLEENEVYTTDIYSITKSTIKIGLQSINRASEHIKVTLYKSNGVSVAVATLSLPGTNVAGGVATTKYVSFTNLDSANRYYAVIKNMDTVQTGSIVGIAKQK